MLARRIGRNELDAIASSPRLRDRAAALRGTRHTTASRQELYATKFQSDPGKQNGLYWPTSAARSAVRWAIVVAQAAEDGRPLGADRTKPTPFHGYYFKILTGQGAAATGGAKSYLVKGEMSRGFALVAWPAQYDATGVMTFIVNQDGIVREKDLGPRTRRDRAKDDRLQSGRKLEAGSVIPTA